MIVNPNSYWNDGPYEMNNVNVNMNPVAVGLGDPKRKIYFIYACDKKVEGFRRHNKMYVHLAVLLTASQQLPKQFVQSRLNFTRVWALQMGTQTYGPPPVVFSIENRSRPWAQLKTSFSSGEIEFFETMLMRSIEPGSQGSLNRVRLVGDTTDGKRIVVDNEGHIGIWKVNRRGDVSVLWRELRVRDFNELTGHIGRWYYEKKFEQ